MADEYDVDTVTPLDGDGSNVVLPPVGDEGNLAAQFDNVQPEDYDTRGQTTVATPRGYAFASSNKDVPVITHAGVKVTADVANELVAESDEVNGGVYIVTNDDTSEEG